MPHPLPPADVHEVLSVCARAAQLPGPYELDLAAFSFLAESAPELDHMAQWVRTSLGHLLSEIAQWPGARRAQVHPTHGDLPGEADRVMLGAVVALAALVDADTCDPEAARVRLSVPSRAAAREAARLVLAATPDDSATAWARLVDVFAAHQGCLRYGV